MSADDVAAVMGALVGDGGKEEIEVSAAASSSRTGLSSGDSQEGTQMVKVEGGLILEVSKGRVRKVEQFNDHGPRGAGNTVGKMGIADREILEMVGLASWGWVEREAIHEVGMSI